MPVVRIFRTVPTESGAYAPASGTVTFTPTAARVVAGDPDQEVLPRAFTARLGTDGTLDVTLAPTDATWCWQAMWTIDGVTSEVEHIAVPDVAGLLDWPDLTRVDPATFDAIAEPETAWWAALGDTELDSITTGLVSRMTARPTRVRISAIRSLIQSLISAGIWDKLDALYLLAAHSQQAALCNWVGCAQDLTAVNAPLFTVDRGFTGGALSYLDTATAGNTLEGYLATDASMGVYVRTAGTGVDISIGAYAYMDANSVLKANNTGDEISISNGGAATGLFAWSRAATSVTAYHAGISLGSVAVSSSYLGASYAILLRNASGLSYSTRELSAAYFGAGLDAGEHASINAAIVSYLTSVGAI